MSRLATTLAEALTESEAADLRALRTYERSSDTADLTSVDCSTLQRLRLAEQRNGRFTVTDLGYLVLAELPR